MASGLEVARGLLPGLPARCHERRAQRQALRAPSLTLSERLRASFLPDRARGVRAILHIRTGEWSGYPSAKLELGDGRCVPAGPDQEPTVSLVLSEPDLFTWLDGERQLLELLASGRVQVSGDMILAVRLPDFFAAGRR